MTPPSVPFSVWVWAALDPVLIAVAVTLGWRASQFGKVFIAAIAAIGIALVVDALVTAVGLPWFAPLSRTGPMLLPVRSASALLFAVSAYGTARLIRRGGSARDARS